MDNLFSKYESVDSPSKYKYASKKQNKLDRLIELMDIQPFTNISIKETKISDNDDNWFSVSDDLEEDQPNYKQMSLQQVLDKSGLNQYVKITSGYRSQNIGTAGSRSWHKKKNEYGLSMAYDITPKNGISFDDMFKKIKGSQIMTDWLRANNFNINDETDAATLRRTGGTGAHFHIGPDKFNVRKAQSGLDFKKLLSYYQPVSLNDNENINKIKISSKPKESDNIFSLYAPSKSTTTKVSDDSDDDREWFIEIPQTSQEKQKREFTNYAGYNKFSRDFDAYGTDDIFKNHKNFWSQLAATESSFKPTAQNKSGAYGYFQLMPQSCSGRDIPTQFNDAAKLMKSHMRVLSQVLTEDDIKKAKQKGITEEGIMAGAWLGGPKGVRDALRGISDSKDSNGTSVMSYMKKFSSNK